MSDFLHDDVDRIISAWQTQRPDLDVSPLAVLSRVSRLARHLDSRRRQAFLGHGLEIWEFDVLAALRKADHPYTLSPGELLTETLVSSGTMTNRIDRLVARGLVSREPSPTDRRSVRVALTAEGLAAVDAAMVDLLAAEESILADLSPAEREELATLLRRVVLPFEAGNAAG